MTINLDDVCVHDITRRFCSLCNGLEKRQKEEILSEIERVLALPGWFTSSFSGVCVKCFEPFGSGIPIRKKTALDRIPQSEKSWIAMCCAPEDE